MNRIYNLAYPLLLCCMMLCWTSCSNEDGDSSSRSNTNNQSNITFLASTNGLGDNGYIDNAIGGVLSFVDKHATRFHLLQPSSKEEAEQMYQAWLKDNAQNDSCLIILGSSDYEEMACKYQTNFSGKGTQVLLFESRASNTPLNVYSLCINRYGCSYLVGAMSTGRDAKIWAATAKDSVVRTAVRGFSDGYNAHNKDQHNLCVKFFSDKESGFANPDSVYKEMKKEYDEDIFAEDIIFPLLGFSGLGIIRYANINTFFSPWIIGMDINQKGMSRNIPFSMVVKIGDMLREVLEDWRQGKEWKKVMLKGMEDHAIDIEFTPNFDENIFIGYPEDYEGLYKLYLNEALEKDEYEKSK